MINKKKDIILGSRRLSNYWWATTICLGGLCFFAVGLSSYANLEFIPFTNLSQILFIPQGVVMLFYGTLAISLSLFLWLTIFWNVGAGYNEFNNQNGYITIYRQGFPGKNRFLLLKYNIEDVQSIKIYIQDGFNPKREIYLKIKDNREIPLTSISQPLLLSEIEQKAINLAQFLGVIVEGLE